MITRHAKRMQRSISIGGFVSMLAGVLLCTASPDAIAFAKYAASVGNTIEWFIPESMVSSINSTTSSTKSEIGDGRTDIDDLAAYAVDDYSTPNVVDKWLFGFTIDMQAWGEGTGSSRVEGSGRLDVVINEEISVTFVARNLTPVYTYTEKTAPGDVASASGDFQFFIDDVLISLESFEETALSYVNEYVQTLATGSHTFRMVAFVEGEAITGMPEPTTLALFGLGLAGLRVAQRKRVL